MQATANPVIKGVVVHGANVLPQKEIEDAFKHQFGRTLNFPQFSGALKRLNKWYEDRGIFGQVGKDCQPRSSHQNLAVRGTSACGRPTHLPTKSQAHCGHQVCTSR
jgi:hypothetical protein